MRRDRSDDPHPLMDARWFGSDGVREMILESLSTESTTFNDLTTFCLLLGRLFPLSDVQLFTDYARQVVVGGTRNPQLPDNWRNKCHFMGKFLTVIVNRPELNIDLMKLMNTYFVGLLDQTLTRNFQVSWFRLVETFLSRFVSRRVSFVYVPTPGTLIHMKPNSSGVLVRERVVLRNGCIRCEVHEPVGFS